LGCSSIRNADHRISPAVGEKQEGGERDIAEIGETLAARRITIVWRSGSGKIRPMVIVAQTIVGVVQALRKWGKTTPSNRSFALSRRVAAMQDEYRSTVCKGASPRWDEEISHHGTEMWNRESGM
jgi:hypothetical protein